jgi:ABC-type multidrug transport system fused ATPase/permease subunit
VLQDPILFSGTLADNIRYGKPDATLQEIEEAARIAEIHDLIISLRHGYESKLGEEGMKLSVGEKQRVAVARAVVSDPKILVLDEATSSLDSESEALIQKALGNVLEGRTAFIIAHRLSTIVNADLIVVMEKGRIVETGNHRELIIREGGYYQKLYQKQFALEKA